MNIMRIAFGLLLLGALGAGSANASTIQLDLKHIGWSNGYSDGKIGGVNDIGARAGEFRFEVTTVYNEHDVVLPFIDESKQLLAFCIDVEVFLQKEGTYSLADISDTDLADGRHELLGKLYDHHYDSIDDGKSSAAFQLAVWEILYDGNGQLDLGWGQGTFYASQFQGAREMAQEWLDGLADLDGLGIYALSVLDPLNQKGGVDFKTNQRLITAHRVPNDPPGSPTPVTEPTTLALFGIALAGLVWVRRRALAVERSQLPHGGRWA